MNILSIPYYAQIFFEKIVEPHLSDKIKKIIVNLNKEAVVYLQDLFSLELCKDEQVINDIIYSFQELFENSDKRKIYYAHLFHHIDNYFKINKIEYFIDSTGKKIILKLNYNFSPGASYEC
jgi:hypothetical protein